MIKRFSIHNIIVEKAGINLDLVYLSEQLYELIKDNKKSTYKFDGSFFNINILHINSITITITNSVSSLDNSSSKITEKGFNIIINLNKNEINRKVIHHELNHALKFYMVGKDKTIEKSHQLKSYLLSRRFIKTPEIEDFITLYYYSDLDEIDSFISEAYYEILEKFKKINSKITKNEFNNFFNIFYKELFLYDVSLFLKRYNLKKLKKLNSDNLVIFFNILNDKKNLLKTVRKSDNFKKFIIDIWDVINNRYLKNLYYDRIDKSVKIENLSEILKIYEIRFNKAYDKITKKMPKLYSIVLEELTKENKII